MRPGATFTNMIFFIDKIVCNQTMDNGKVYGYLERKFCISRVRKNSLITRETIICIYERDTIHDLSFNTNPDLKLRYRNLRNNVTFLIRKNKYEYFEKVNVTCAGNSRKFWREIKSMLPQVNFKSTLDVFTVYFKNVTSVINDNSKSDSNDDILCKGSKSINTFTFVEVPKSQLLSKGFFWHTRASNH